jgi:hypothetical protein
LIVAGINGINVGSGVGIGFDRGLHRFWYGLRAERLGKRIDDLRRGLAGAATDGGAKERDKDRRT